MVEVLERVTVLEPVRMESPTPGGWLRLPGRREACPVSGLGADTLRKIALAGEVRARAYVPEGASRMVILIEEDSLRAWIDRLPTPQAAARQIEAQRARQEQSPLRRGRRKTQTDNHKTEEQNHAI